MELLTTFITVGVALALGYVVFRAYWMGSDYGFNSELRD